jgi:hypothetical protein
MNFTLTDDQAAVVDAVERLARQFDTKPTDFDGYALHSAALEQELENGQYFDIATFTEMGPITAALAVERLARSPFTVEVALSMLLRPQLGEELPRPFAVVENGRPGRFVDGARTVLLIEGDSLALVHPEAGATRPVESIYAYPMGELIDIPERRELSAEQAELARTWQRVACAAEIAGLMQASIDATVEHLSVRKQFGRPLGTFQALRHRMAECAVLAGGVKRLALRAAWSGDAGDAALAALHAQDSANKLNYDVHQMMGAMGMTLEMPLHLWTYRIKALLSDSGGRGGQASAVAQYCFAEAG